MTDVVRISGAPGAGKTYTLKQKLREEKRDGLTKSGFWWLTFTRAGRADVEPELRDVYPDADEIEDRARTLHSLALRLLIIEGHIDMNTGEETDIPGPIITPGQFRDGEIDPYAEFCESKGMRYDPDAADPRKLLAGEESTEYEGNKLFAINDFLTQTAKAPEKWRSAPIDIRIPGDRVMALLEEWDEFKRSAFDWRLFEHGDYVEYAYEKGVIPGVKVLLIDEFQDFAPLEYRLYKHWRDAGSIARIYLAGDPNQSVYSFRGGTPHYFENTARDEIITLQESRRCPAEIADVGHTLLSAHPQTDPRGFQGRDPGGTVEWAPVTDKWGLRDQVITAAESYHSADPPVMLLTRTNAQLRRLTKDLRAVGIPFEVLGSNRGVWRDDLRQMLAFLNNWDSGGSAYAYPNLRKVLSALPDSDARRSRLGTNLGPVLDRKAVSGALEDFSGSVDLLEHLQIDAWKRDILKNAVKAPAALEPNEVQIGTIHRAKGLEAPVVFLFGSSSKGTVRKYSRDEESAAEEHRIYYVGTTRASEELYLISEYFNGPTAPPLEKIRRLTGVTA